MRNAGSPILTHDTKDGQREWISTPIAEPWPRIATRRREPDVIPPFAYLAAIVVSSIGLLAIDRRFRLGVLGRPLLVAIVVVEIAFVAFDLIGSTRGWFASNPDFVIAIIPPGIPPEEPLLLAFLTLFTIVIYRLAGRWTGEG